MDKQSKLSSIAAGVLFLSFIVDLVKSEVMPVENFGQLDVATSTVSIV